jgi:predicted acetyltransferase
MNIDVKDEGDRHELDLVVGGKSISGLEILDLVLRIGESKLKMAGIAGVRTDDGYRMKGYASKVLSQSIDYMVKGGYDISMLFGIEDFYQRWGFATCLPEYELTIPTRNAERALKRYDSRPFLVGDVEDILAMYEQNNRHRSCWIERSKGTWRPFRKGTWFDKPAKCNVMVDDGKLIGYYAYDDSRYETRITEVGSAKRDVFESMLRDFADMAIERRAERISVNIPPDHPLATFCRRYGCSLSIGYPYNANGMMRIINLNSFLHKLKPELERALGLLEAHYRGTRTLKITTDLGEAMISISGHEVSVEDPSRHADASIYMPQSVLMQCISGFRGVSEVLTDCAVKMDGEAEDILSDLFIQKYPHCWLADAF